MRVGIDARCLSRQLTGIGYYCLSVIKELEKRNIEVVLFSSSALSIDNSILKPSTRIISGSWKGAVSKQFWGEVILPFMLRKHSLDLFWGPSHRLPFMMSTGLPSVVTIHDLVWRRVPETMSPKTRFLERWLMPVALRKADVVLADSSSTLDDLIQDYPQHADKIIHVPLGSGPVSSVNECDSKEVDKIALEKPYMLFVGTFEPRKNITRLLQAFSELDLELRNSYNLVIVGGSGWGGIDVKSLVDKLGLESSVIILSYQPIQSLHQLYKNAYGLIFPSLYEGFGLPILEAHSFGVPVITSTTSSMPEIAGEGALYVDPYSTKSIHDALDRLLKHHTLREELSQKAMLNAKKYTWERTVDKMLEGFERAIAC